MRSALVRLLALGIVFILGMMGEASAHHILGVPHYAYDEDYPQTPVLTYRFETGAHEVRLTGNPGKPQPGERCSIHVYITRMDTGEPFDDTVTLTVTRDKLFGRDTVVYGPQEGSLEEAMYKFFPEFPDEANYTARIFFEAEGAPWTIDLPMVAGEPGSPWAVLGATLGGLVVFVVVIRAIRIKRKRRARLQASRASNPIEPTTLMEPGVSG